MLAASLVDKAGYIEDDPGSFFAAVNWGALAAFIVVTAIVNLLCYGISLGMACDAVETGEATIAGGFSRFFSRIGQFIIAAILVGIIMVVGLLLCILPGLAALFFMMFTLIGVVYSKRNAMDAISGSIEMAKNNAPTALVFLLIVFGILFSGSLISNVLEIVPVVGSIAGAVLKAALSVLSSVLLVKVYAELLEPALIDETVTEGL